MLSHFCISVIHLHLNSMTKKILLLVALTLSVTKNNSLRYFRNLQFVQHKLFQAYCTSLYGSELWLLTNCNIDALCVAWQKIVLRIWNLQFWTHSQLLPFMYVCIYAFIRQRQEIQSAVSLFANVYHYSMRFVGDHLTSFAHVLFTIHF